MELLVFAVIVVLFIGALITASFLARPAKRQPADLAADGQKLRHEPTPPHKPEEWTKTR